MAGWHDVGSGFSGIKKFERIGASFQGVVNSEETSVDIRTEGTPESKKKRRNIEKKLQSRDEADKKGRKLLHGRGRWQQEELSAAFSVVQTREKSGQEDTEISWSDSSSEESTCKDDAGSGNRNVRKRSSTSAMLKVEKRRSNPEDENPSPKDTSAPHAAQCLANTELKQCKTLSLPPRLSLCQSEMSSEDISIISQNSITSEGTIVNQTPSSFAQFQESSLSQYKLSDETSPDSVLPVKREIDLHAKTKLNSAKRKHLQPKVARKLYAGCTDPVDGDISDVESEPENVSHGEEDVDTDVSDVTDALDVPASDKISDGSVSQSQLPDIKCELASPPTSPHKEGIKASEWVTAAYKHRTPGKTTEQTDETGHDSAKKKRKYSRGSLSGQLSQLIKREKSAVRFWYHSLNAGAVDEQNSKTITVELVHMKRQFSIYFCRGKVCADDDQDSRETCKVMFLSDMVEKLGIKAGSVVQIFPPWQQLEEASGLRTLLCTQYVRLMSHKDRSAAGPEESNNDSVTSHAMWKCPCVLASAYVPARCRAAQTGVLYGRHCQLDGQGLSLSRIASQNLGQSRLHSIYAASPHAVTLASSALPGLAEAHTLHEALERVGSNSSEVPPFSATVLRVFEYRNVLAGCKRYEVLLEDTAGTVALIRDVDERLTHAGVPITHLEGHFCICKGLMVANRTNWDREPVLFNVIAQAWRLNILSPGQDTDNAHEITSQLYSKCPRFCYVLKSVTGDILNLTAVSATRSENCDRNENRLLNPAVTDDEVFQTDDQNRATLLAWVVAMQCSVSEQRKEPDPTVFVLTQSSQQSFFLSSHQLEVAPECGSGQELTGLRTPQLCLLRDILFDKGNLKCDQYSLAVKKSSWESRGLNSRLPAHILDRLETQVVKLAPVTAITCTGCLASVEGHISGVDEKSSYSWEVCDVCGTDQLETQSKGDCLWCSVCQHDVLSPEVRIKMAVYIRCSDLPHHAVIRADLLQKTIESLLPQDQGEEGYDVEQVSGKRISLPVCLVQQNGAEGPEADEKVHQGTEGSHDKGSNAFDSRIIYLTELEWG